MRLACFLILIIGVLCTSGPAAAEQARYGDPFPPGTPEAHAVARDLTTDYAREELGRLLAEVDVPLAGARVRPQLHVDGGGQILEGTCTCRQFSSHQLTKGPCEHLLALRLAHLDKLEHEDSAQRN